MPARPSREPGPQIQVQEPEEQPINLAVSSIHTPPGYDTRPLPECELEAFLLPETRIVPAGYGDTPDGKAALRILEIANGSPLGPEGKSELMARLQVQIDAEVEGVKAEWVHDGRMVIDEGEAYLQGCERWLAKQDHAPVQDFDEDAYYDHLGHCDIEVPARDLKPVTDAGFRGKFAFLSNFHEAPVQHEGHVYRCSEAAFQAAKFLDPAFRARFADLDGQAAKSLGKTRHPSFRQDWETAKVQIMRGVLESKFRDPALREALIATSGTNLEERNTWGDTFWGIAKGRGENRLGKLLMELREQVQRDGGR